MADAVYRPRREAFRELAVGPEIRAALAAVADNAKTIAEGLAQDFRVTGEYAESFETSTDTIQWQGRFSGPRAVARLTNTSDHAAAVEWGNAHAHRNHRVLGRTLAALDRA